jgi:hypothetical protein
MIADLRDYGVEEILRDGRSIHVRAIRPDSRQRLVDHFHRLSARSDRETLVALITRVSALVEVVPELRELDLNPVKVLEPGRGVVVVDARMRWVLLPDPGSGS